MQAILADLIGRLGYAAIFLLIAAENIFPPIPSEVILTFGGFMTTRTGMTVFGAAVFATLGSVAGAVLLYFVGAVLAGRRIPGIANWGRFLGLEGNDVQRAGRWFQKRGGKAVFLCRMVPILRSLISIPAGMAGMRLGPFLLLSGAGSLIWNVALLAAGAALGDAWEDILRFLDVYKWAAAGALLLLAAGGLLWHKSRKRRQ